MTAKEKATDLFWNMKMEMKGPGIEAAEGNAKRCALICAEQCRLEAYKQGNEMAAIREKFWYDVISELEKL